jgi:hypothetical protein
MFILILLIMCAAFWNSQMDTVKDKYSSSIYVKVALFLYKIKIFKTLDLAERWFNKDGLGWTNAYINNIKSNGYKTYNILWFKLKKPAVIVDAWHFFKGLMLTCLVLIMVITNPISFHFISGVFTYLIDYILYSLIWSFTFTIFYNKK